MNKELVSGLHGQANANERVFGEVFRVARNDHVRPTSESRGHDMAVTRINRRRYGWQIQVHLVHGRVAVSVSHCRESSLDPITPVSWDPGEKVPDCLVENLLTPARLIKPGVGNPKEQVAQLDGVNDIGIEERHIRHKQLPLIDAELLSFLGEAPQNLTSPLAALLAILEYISKEEATVRADLT